MNRQFQPKSGFTLVELLVVIVVIGVLMGLLLVALGPINRTAQSSAITMEMNQIAGAIEQFKTKFGFIPPCEFDLDGDGTTNLATDPEDFAIFKQYLRRIAPNHTETDAAIGQWWADVGANLDNDSVLVFWLSGINENAQYPLTSYGQDMNYGTADDTSGNAFDGKNATEAGYAPTYRPPQKIVLFEFSPTQFQDVSLKVKRYLQRKVGAQPYLYFDAQQYTFAVFPNGATSSPPAVYPYRDTATTFYNDVARGGVKFQLIAAGVDKDFGAMPGGDWQSPPQWKFQRDNITNFAGGVLERVVQ